jgi:hypothetical protein
MKRMLFVVGVIVVLFATYWVAVPKTWLGPDGLRRVQYTFSSRVCVAMPHDQWCQFPLLYEPKGK